MKTFHKCSKSEGKFSYVSFKSVGDTKAVLETNRTIVSLN